jgi:PEP-CTERM motif
MLSSAAEKRRSSLMKFQTKLLGGLISAVFAATAHATVIDFGDVASGNCASSGLSVQSRGFNFTGNPQDGNLYVCNAGVIQNNTTPALINANSRSILTMSEASGAVFSLESFFAGGRTEDFNPAGEVTFYSVATSIDIVGNLLGGGSVFASVVLDSIASYDFTQFTLPNTFVNLLSVTFTAQGRGDTPEFLIDDIVVNSDRVVPEPGTLALIAGGLLGAGAARRRRS